MFIYHACSFFSLSDACALELGNVELFRSNVARHLARYGSGGLAAYPIFRDDHAN